MITLQHLESALTETPNLSATAYHKGRIAQTQLMTNNSAHIECDKTTLGELSRALQVETHWNGRTFSLTIVNDSYTVILQTPVNSNAK